MTLNKYFKSLKVWAKNLKHKIYTLYFAYKDKRVKWFSKVFTIVIVAYAFSPIDLIPDFIPILGYIDDLIILPIGIWLALKMIPDNVLIDSEDKASSIDNIKANWIIGSFIIIIWSSIVIGLVYYLKTYSN